MDKYLFSELFCLIFLYLCGVEDYHKKKLSIVKFWLFGCVGCVYTIVSGMLSPKSILLGASVGIAMVVVSKCGVHSMGEGDGWMMAVTGVFLGIRQNLGLLCMALFLCGGYGLFGLLLKKYKRKDCIALAPFVLIADVIRLYLM